MDGYRLSACCCLQSLPCFMIDYGYGVFQDKCRQAFCVHGCKCKQRYLWHVSGGFRSRSVLRTHLGFLEIASSDEPVRLLRSRPNTMHKQNPPNKQLCICLIRKFESLPSCRLCGPSPQQRNIAQSVSEIGAQEAHRLEHLVHDRKSLNHNYYFSNCVLHVCMGTDWRQLRCRSWLAM